jgi:UDPglucose 6-dehydrogenase
LIDAVLASNAIHAQWAEQRVLELVGTIEAPRVAVLGLTYKPGTDTLRRSSALEIAQKLVDRGVSVSAFDPAISVLPSELKAIELAHNVDAALAGADVALIATPWPQFRDLSAERFKQVMRRPQVVDPTSALESLASDPDLIYVRVGVAARK